MTDSWAGVFGKYPLAGDFVTRDLPNPVRRGFDLWLTQNVARIDGDWPQGGLRGLLTFSETPALFLAVPSRDKVGRRFPLAALTAGKGLSLEEAESWCDAILPAAETVANGAASLDTLSLALDAAKLAGNGLDTGEDALWVRGEPPMPPDTETLSTFLQFDKS